MEQLGFGSGTATPIGGEGHDRGTGIRRQSPFADGATAASEAAKSREADDRRQQSGSATCYAREKQPQSSHEIQG
jgi:hypothetical protein